jgi:hypothetical protein
MDKMLIIIDLCKTGGRLGITLKILRDAEGDLLVVHQDEMWL